MSLNSNLRISLELYSKNKHTKGEHFMKSTMSEEEETDLGFFGTPLEPYDEDAFPKRKPISLEDQIATDSHGRRRFHGAFTGGFSAGFFNTVGSLEGWTPSEFKSTRSEKATKHVQKPEDFMDDEDIGEYGIAPQTIKATKEYSTVKKRSRKVLSDGPIPGVPVLETLITSGNETVGYMLLRNMGIEDKIKKKEQELNQGGKVYGCEMPTKYQIPEDIRGKEYQMPDIYKEYLQHPKSNTAGLGYKGLEKPHVNLFHSTNLVVRDKNDKRISIGGQAFGVGAFEDDDDDIYKKDDMSNYDFELTKEKEKPISTKAIKEKMLVFNMFEQSSAPLVRKKQYTPPTIPHWFTGVHKVRKSRFEPIEAVKEEPPPRNRINPIIRARYLGEDVNETFTPSKQEPSSSKLTDDTTVEDASESKSNNQEPDISSFLTDRFVSASQNEDVSNILEKVEKSETTHGTEQMREAARMKMFGPLTRITSEWQPCSVLCKRFNVPEPFRDQPSTSKKRTRNLIFQAQKLEDDIPDLKPGISRNLEEVSANTTIEEPIKIEPEIKDTNETPISKTSHSEDNIKNEENDAPLLQMDDIEQPSEVVDLTEKIGIENKINLYKAVFLSSSESEDETEDQTTNKFEEFKATILSEPLIPQIKPIKEGILSGINFKDFNLNRSKTQIDDKPEEKKDEEKKHVQVIPLQDPLLYGPQLPLSNGKSKSMQNIPKTQIVISSDSEDDWVEKDAVKKDKKTSKHKKKDKKHKHKKHKKKDRR